MCGVCCLKTVKINNGDVYLYNSSQLEFNKEYATNYIDKLVLNDYEGRLGLNNVVLEVYGNTTLRGFLKYPAYIFTSGSVDLTIPDTTEYVKSLNAMEADIQSYL